MTVDQRLCIRGRRAFCARAHLVAQRCYPEKSFFHSGREIVFSLKQRNRFFILAEAEGRFAPGPTSERCRADEAREEGDDGRRAAQVRVEEERGRLPLPVAVQLRHVDLMCVCVCVCVF